MIWKAPALYLPLGGSVELCVCVLRVARQPLVIVDIVLPLGTLPELHVDRLQNLAPGLFDHAHDDGLPIAYTTFEIFTLHDDHKEVFHPEYGSARLSRLKVLIDGHKGAAAAFVAPALQGQRLHDPDVPLKSPTTFRHIADLNSKSSISKPTGCGQENSEPEKPFSSMLSLATVIHVKASAGRADTATTPSTGANLQCRSAETLAGQLPTLILSTSVCLLTSGPSFKLPAGMLQLVSLLVSFVFGGAERMLAF